jgi:hypothetical protein
MRLYIFAIPDSSPKRSKIARPSRQRARGERRLSEGKSRRAADAECVRGQPGRDAVEHRQPTLEPVHGLTGMHPPVAVERDQDSQRKLGLVGVERQRHDLADVRVLHVEPVERRRLRRPTLELASGLLGERQQPVEVGEASGRGLSFGLELFQRELPDRLEHPEAFPGAAEKALLDQGLEDVEIGPSDLRCRLEGAAAGEDAEPAEEARLPLAEEVV